MTKPIDTKIPLAINTRDGFYDSNNNIKDSVKQSLKCLFLTSKGERVRDVDFGIGIYRYLFELGKSQHFKDILREDIHRQIKKYMPYIFVLDLGIKLEEEKFYIKLSYNIPSAGVGDSLSFEVQ